MFKYPDLEPVALALGPLKIHWYGLMYLVGFLGFWWLGRLRARRFESGWQQQDVDDLLFYGVLGVVLGGRLGYILFYGLGNLLRDPLSLFRIWEGGMSFHGGLLGVLIAMAIYGHKQQRGFFHATDFIAPLVPIGLGAGRLGNFINAELWGAPTNLPWGVQVPCQWVAQICQGAGLWSPPLHPSQLYEALLEGVLLFIVLWIFSSKTRPRSAVSGLFLLLYGLFRFGVEFVRMPDSHLGYLAFNWLTMGQLLSLPMILAGLVLLVLAYRKGTASALV